MLIKRATDFELRRLHREDVRYRRDPRRRVEEYRRRNRPRALITFVSSSELNQVGDNNTTYTTTTNIGTRTNGLLILNLFMVSDIAVTVSSSSYASVALAKAVELSQLIGAIYFLSSIWYLAAPTNGSNTLSVTFSTAINSTRTMGIVPSWYDGGHQTQASVKDQHNSGTGATDPSIDITPSEDNELIVDGYLSEAAAILTPVATQAAIQTHDLGPRTWGCSYLIQTTAALRAMAWTGVDDSWGSCAASFKQAASGTQYNQTHTASMAAWPA